MANKPTDLDDRVDDDTTRISFRAQVNIVRHDKKQWLPVAIVVGALLLLVGGAYLVYDNNKKQQQEAEQVNKAKKDVAPAAQ